MKRRSVIVGAVCLAFVLSSCTVTVNTIETKVKARNDLVSMTYEGSDIDAIDLEGVDIGDVTFATINAGTTTSERTTTRSGTVGIVIDVAYVETYVLGQAMTIPIDNVTGMSTSITKDVVNTVVFNATTAAVIFNELAKKKAK